MDRKKTAATITGAVVLCTALALFFVLVGLPRLNVQPMEFAGLASADIAPAAPPGGGLAQSPPAMRVSDSSRKAYAAPPGAHRESMVLAQNLDEIVAEEPLPGSTVAWDDEAGTLISEENRINVNITLDNAKIGVRGERKYVLEFEGVYVVRNPEDYEVFADFVFPFPANTTSKWDTRLLVDGEEPKDAKFSKDEAVWSAEIPAGKQKTIEIAYKTRGSSRFAYDLAHNYRVRNLDVVMTVLGGRGDIEIPESALEPSEPLRRTEDGNGWTVSWKYQDVVVDRDIEVLLAAGHKPVFTAAALGRLRWLAVLFLGLFVMALATAARIEDRSLAPHEYLLAGICFFLFYPLLVFASAYMQLPYALGLSLVLIAVMIVRYVTAITDVPFALKYAGASLAVFLGFSSVVIIAPAAMGLATVLGALLLVGLFMEVTARHGLSAAEPASQPPAQPAPEIQGQAPAAPPTQQGGYQ